MSTATRLDPTRGGPPDVDDRRAGGTGPRPPVWLTIAVTTILIVTAGIFGVRYLVGRTSRPLTEGSGYRGARGPTVEELGTFHDSSGAEVWAFHASFRQGASFSYWVDLYNDGPRTVTITRVGPKPPPLYEPGRPQWTLRVQVAHPNGTGLHLSAWHDITLLSHDNLETLVTVRMTGCFEPNSFYVFGDTPVTYQVSGATVRQVVAMDFSVTLEGNRLSACGAPAAS